MAAGSPLTLANGLTVPFSYNNGSNVIFQFDSLAPAGSPGLVIDNGLNVGNLGTGNSPNNTQQILITGAISGTGTYALIATDPGGAGSLANGFSNNTFVLNPVLPNRAVGSLEINPTNPQELDLLVTGLYSVAWTGSRTIGTPTGISSRWEGRTSMASSSLAMRSSSATRPRPPM